MQITAEHAQGRRGNSCTATLQVPISAGHIRFRINISQGEEEAEEPDTGGASASTDVCRPPRPPGGVELDFRPSPLPRPAPGPLARHGLSWRDLVALRRRLRRGELTTEQVAQQLGREAAEYVGTNWRMLDELIADNDSGEGLPHEVRRQANENNTPEEGDETGLFELSGIMEQEREGQHIEEVPQEVQRQASENNTPEEGAEVGLISLPGTILSSYFAMTMGQGDEEQEPDFMQVGYRIISRWRNRGLSLQSATNFLLSLADDRDDGEYMEDYSQHLSQLGLPTEARDNPVELQDEQSDVLVWLEAELWLNWIDYLEGRTGWESEAVRSNRARTTGLDPRDMQGWRDWADALAFPREPPTRPPRSEATETRASGSRRSEPSGEGRASGSRRSQSRSRRTDERAALPRSTRSRSRGRCTTETRRLLPRNHETAGSRRSAPNRMTPAEATARWLYILGFRSSFYGVETQPALPGGRDSFDRDEHIANINPQDIEIMQQGMLRVLAMLMDECSQLLMRHPFFQPPHERDNDDNLLMQTSMLKKERKEKRQLRGGSAGYGK